MISLVWVCVTFLRVVFGNVLVTSAWKRPTNSVQDFSPVYADNEKSQNIA